MPTYEVTLTATAPIVAKVTIDAESAEEAATQAERYADKQAKSNKSGKVFWEFLEDNPDHLEIEVDGAEPYEGELRDMFHITAQDLAEGK